MNILNRKRIIKTLPTLLSAILVFLLGAILRIMTDSGFLHIPGYLLIVIAVLALTVMGNPIKNFEELKQLYTQKMFECVVKKELPEYAPYPSTRPKAEVSEAEPEPQAPPYPRLPEIDLDEVKVPDNSLSEYFTELVALCKAYPKDMNVTFHAPANPQSITAFEKKHKLSLPAELKDLLLFSNGFSLAYDDFYGLEEIEYHLSNWGPLEEAGEEFIYIASAVGDGEEIVFSKKTGLIYWHDHGNFTEYSTLDAVLEERIEYQKEDLGVE